MTLTPDSHRFCVAPMMDWTDRHCRAFHRTLSRRALLYTEMVTSAAVIHGPRDRLLGFDAGEHPVAVQLGGSDPGELAQAAKIAEDYGYAEINLNVGCPSDRVQSGRFGACLMREPELVAECVAAMAEAVSVPVTVKSRIGVDDQDPEASLFGFVEIVAATGVRTFIVHARKAWLKGLSPKENREIPPLDYDLVSRLKSARPELEIILNGGLKTHDQAQTESQGLDGVMFGRAAYQTPWGLAEVDPRWFGASAPCAQPEDAARAFRPYLARALEAGTPLHAMTRHMLGLFQGRKGARAWRRTLSEHGPKARGLEALAVYDAALAALAPPDQAAA
ncbi:MAG: tRNA dihydrouridine(20/20a) synthase DusA [Maricaulaceae bacterium]